MINLEKEVSEFHSFLGLDSTYLRPLVPADKSEISKDYDVQFYPEKEEKINIISHGIGFLLSIIGTVLLLLKAQQLQSSIHVLSFAIYGGSMMCLYAASTLYHSAKDPKRRRMLNLIDHSAIFVLIAGTYTPFTLVTLQGPVGNKLLLAIWFLALVGILFKLFFIGKYKHLSMALYVLMGWLVIFAIKPLFANLHLHGFIILMMGGFFYSVGAVFFSRESINLNHAIFHYFVLAGSLCHFLSVYLYV